MPTEKRHRPVKLERETVGRSHTAISDRSGGIHGARKAPPSPGTIRDTPDHLYGVNAAYSFHSATARRGDQTPDRVAAGYSSGVCRPSWCAPRWSPAADSARAGAHGSASMVELSEELQKPGRRSFLETTAWSFNIGVGFLLGGWLGTQGMAQTTASPPSTRRWLDGGAEPIVSMKWPGYAVGLAALRCPANDGGVQWMEAERGFSGLCCRPGSQP